MRRKLKISDDNETKCNELVLLFLVFEISFSVDLVQVENFADQ